MKSAVNHFIDQKEFPAVSIVLPTHPQYPKFKIDREHLLRLIKQVNDQLNKRYDGIKTEVMMERLHKVINGIDFSSLSNGLAIYVSPHSEKVIHLPFEVTSEKVIVDESFEIRDVIYAVKTNRNYLLAVLSQNNVKTFFGFDSTLSEVTFPDMPEDVKDVTNEHSFPGLDYLDTNAYNEKNIKNYLRFIDDVIEKESRKFTYPVIMMGDQKLLGLFKKHSKNAKRIIGSVEGNYEHLNKNDLRKKVQPVLDKMGMEEEEKALKMLAGAVSKDNYASGIAEVWRAAAEEKGRLLIVEKDYKQPARYGTDSFTILVDDEVKNVRYNIADAVDDIMEMVLKNKGDVVFVGNDKLKNYQRIALVTRY